MQIVEALLQNDSFKAAIVGFGICFSLFGLVLLCLFDLFFDYILKKFHF